MRDAPPQPAVPNDAVPNDAVRSVAASQPAVRDDATPLLSVTVLNYNYARYLPRCLDSILGQLGVDFEVILIDDCSSDDSRAVIAAYAEDPRVRVVAHAANQGFVASLIEGCRLSRGRYLTVISADDYCLSSRAFAALLELLERDQEAVLAYSAYGQYNNAGERHYLRRPYAAPYIRAGAEEFRELVLDPYILHSGAIIRRSAYDAVGGYDAAARYAVDVKIWLLLCAQGKVAYCPEELYAYRMHQANMSHSGPAIRTSLRETIDGITGAFAALRDDQRPPRELYRRAIQCALVAIPTDDIFAGRLRRGWYGYWCALRMHPALTVLQARTPILLARTLLGRRYFGALRSLLRRGKRQAAPA